MKEVARAIMRSEVLQRKELRAKTAVETVRLMAAGRIFKRQGKICLQAY